MTVCFQKFQVNILHPNVFSFFKDKTEVLRRSVLLRGSNVLITEVSHSCLMLTSCQDFPKRVREHRAVLSKFAKEVTDRSTPNDPAPQIRRRDPEARIHLQWDKLFINSQVVD